MINNIRKPIIQSCFEAFLIIKKSCKVNDIEALRKDDVVTEVRKEFCAITFLSFKEFAEYPKL